jgi:hypothetical protein
MAYLVATSKGGDGSFNVHCVRELSGEEMSTHDNHVKEFVTLRQRLSLLQILHQNFLSTISFLNELEATSQIETDAAVTETNRHFMGYLSAAYSLREHLKTCLARDFGSSSTQATQFGSLLKLMESKSFSYAFFQDFRNYVQHCGFPVGNLTLTQKPQGRSLKLTCSRVELLRDYSSWRKSRLARRTEAEFDLVALLRAHHNVVMNEFPAAILAGYGRNIEATAKYFKTLHQEAQKVRPGSEAKLALSLPRNAVEGTLVLSDFPVDPLGQLGLRKKTKPSGTSGARSQKLPPAGLDTAGATVRKHVNFEILRISTREQERYFDVLKNDIIGFHPSMTNLDYDPFPNALHSDVVDRVPMGRELLLEASVKAPAGSFHMGTSIQHAGHVFALTAVNEKFDTEGEHSSFDVEGVAWLSYTEPLKIISDIRKRLSLKR